MPSGIRIESASILILRMEFGTFPHILPLNPALRPGVPSLKLHLEVEWSPPDAAPLLRRFQRELVEFLPGFGRHQCRGAAEYHVLGRGSLLPAATNGRSTTIDAPLALVHLVEHLLIDAVASVTDLESVSGVTAAYRSSDSLYDLFVECPEPALAPLAIDRALTWVASLLLGEPLGADDRVLLRLGRALYANRSLPLDAMTLARVAGVEPSASEAALGWLEDLGVACRESQNAHLTGAPLFILCVDAESDRSE